MKRFLVVVATAFTLVGPARRAAAQDDLSALVVLKPVPRPASANTVYTPEELAAMRPDLSAFDRLDRRVARDILADRPFEHPTKTYVDDSFDDEQLQHVADVLDEQSRRATALVWKVWLADGPLGSKLLDASHAARRASDAAHDARTAPNAYQRDQSLALLNGNLEFFEKIVGALPSGRIATVDLSATSEARGQFDSTPANMHNDEGAPTKDEP